VVTVAFFLFDGTPPTHLQLFCRVLYKVKKQKWLEKVTAYLRVDSAGIATYMGHRLKLRQSGGHCKADTLVDAMVS
jgi:hypothetical protein